MVELVSSSNKDFFSRSSSLHHLLFTRPHPPAPAPTWGPHDSAGAAPPLQTSPPALSHQPYVEPAARWTFAARSAGLFPARSLLSTSAPCSSSTCPSFLQLCSLHTARNSPRTALSILSLLPSDCEMSICLHHALAFNPILLLPVPPQLPPPPPPPPPPLSSSSSSSSSSFPSLSSSSSSPLSPPPPIHVQRSTEEEVDLHGVGPML
eukprot:758388-Hanusia_phi.AAC.2